MWQTDGDGTDGCRIFQTEIDQKGSSRGVFQRFRRWIDALGYPGFHLEIVGRPHLAPYVGSPYQRPNHSLRAHCLNHPYSCSLLRSLLVGMDLYVVVPPPIRAGHGPLMKTRLSQKEQRDRVMCLPPVLRLAMLAGLIDGDGWRQHNDSFRFDSSIREMCDMVTFLCRVSGLAAQSPISGPSGWTVTGIYSHFDTQRDLIDSAVAKDRTIVPVGGPNRRSNPYTGRIAITEPVPGAPMQRYVKFQVSDAPGGAALMPGRFLLASGVITHH
jgi:hypothetical protein